MKFTTLCAEQPKGFFPLFFIEMWDRFSYYGFQSVMVLYLIKAFLFTSGHAYSLYGAFITLAFSMPILGGFIADKLVGYKQAIISGVLLLIAANFILMEGQSAHIYFALSLLVCGVGLMKANNASLLGNLYAKDSGLKDSGYTIFYMGMNVGAIFGPLVYGFVAIKYGWHAGFLISGLGLLASLLVLLINRKCYSEAIQLKSQNVTQSKKIKRLSIFVALIFFGILMNWLLILHHKLFQNALWLIFIFVFLGMSALIYKASFKSKISMFILLVLIIFSIFYFTCLMQIGSSLTMFVDKHIDYKLFSVRVPTEAFASFEPFFVIIAAPLFSPVWGYMTRQHHALLSIIVRVGVGLFFAAISFAAISLSAKLSIEHSNLAVYSLVLGYFLLGCGELAIGPALMSAVTTLSPKNLRGTWMGFWFLSIAFSGYLSVFLAKLTTNNQAVLTASSFVNTFSRVEKLVWCVLLLFIVASFWLLRLSHSLNLFEE